MFLFYTYQHIGIGGNIGFPPTVHDLGKKENLAPPPLLRCLLLYRKGTTNKKCEMADLMDIFTIYPNKSDQSTEFDQIRPNPTKSDKIRKSDKI